MLGKEIKLLKQHKIFLYLFFIFIISIPNAHAVNTDVVNVVSLVEYDHGIARHLLADYVRNLGVQEVMVGVYYYVGLLNCPPK